MGDLFRVVHFGVLTLPTSVTSIGELTFDGCPITSLTVLATTPPEGGANSGINARSCTLFVPEEALETYEDSEWWDFFKEIKPISSPSSDPEPVWDGECTVTYVDKDASILDTEILTFNLPETPVFAGFTFIKWTASSDNLEEGLTIQAIYEYAGDPTSAPSVYALPSTPAQKLIRQGNIYILTGDRTYTLTGQQVK